jgi:hypothetical protein
MTKIERKKPDISFLFNPHLDGQGICTVTKADSSTPGLERRYLRGISSGPQLDQHEERMTQECIDDFMRQANEDDILLYVDLHGFGATEDIGILTKAEVLDNGDWYTEYRLFDSADDPGTFKLETIETVWKQMNGLPPYTKAKKRGFSIEGDIPDDGIVSAEVDEKGNLIKRVLRRVDLTGVVLVPKPAYKPSVASAVYKALGEMSPKKREAVKKTIQGVLRQKVDQENAERDYYETKWKLIDALDEVITGIMKKKDTDKEEQLNVAFDEFKSMMVIAIMEAQSMFLDEDDLSNPTDGAYAVTNSENREHTIKALKSLVGPLKNLVRKKQNERKKHKSNN